MSPEERGLTRAVGLFPIEPVKRIVELSVLAEELGYSHVWFGDSQNIWREVYITMGAVAQATENVILGTGVTNAITRHPSVLASVWATLSEMTGGRAALGIGTGDSSLRTMGLKPMRLKDLEATVADLRTLFRGEPVSEATSDLDYRLAYLPSPQKVPVYIACSAPKILKLAGKIADGVILLVGTHSGLIQAAIEKVAEGAAEAGRSMDDIHLVLWTPTAIDADGKAARDLVRAHVARAVIRPLPFELAPELMEDIENIRKTYDYYHHMDVSANHADLVPDRLVDMFSLSGTADECTERLKDLAGSGIHQVSIVPFTEPGGDRAATIRTFAHIFDAEVAGSATS
ncbi:MAG: LLM class flavin-dependent oxidoreductase [Actinobacteria bacterium]|nr:LLM class flavin-dependent oxidoreductase [Actinomycetota bacterium]